MSKSKKKFEKDVWLRLCSVLRDFNDTELIGEIFVFIESRELMKYNLVAQKFYQQVIPKICPPIKFEWKLIRQLNKGIPRADLKKYAKGGAICKLTLGLGGFLTVEQIKKESKDWCPVILDANKVDYGVWTD